jgi:hypothetical protein
LKVEYSLEKVGKGDSFAPDRAQWAKANVDDAVEKMRVVANDYSQCSEAAQQWSTQIRAQYSIANSVQKVRGSILGC